MIPAIEPERFLTVLKEYWSTYDSQHGWENYQRDTFINDALYGLGLAISEDYRFATGYDAFLRELADYVQAELVLRGMSQAGGEEG